MSTSLSANIPHPSAELDFSWTAPLLHAREHVLSSRMLWSVGGVELWSRVYRVGDFIIKQSSPELAERELAAIAALDDPEIAVATPLERHEQYWSLQMPFWKGVTLDALASRAPLPRTEILSLAQKLVAIVAKLRAKKVEHRDLHPSNVLVLPDGSLRLIDFSWASVPGGRDITPSILGIGVIQRASGNTLDIRPPEGGGDDLYAVGQIVLWLNQSRDPLVQLMGTCLCHRDIRLRVSDVSLAHDIVKALFRQEPSGAALEALTQFAGAALEDARRRVEQAVLEIQGRSAELRAAADDNERLSREKQRLEAENVRLQGERRQLQESLARSNQELDWMRQSLTWKLRTAWVATRDTLRRRR